MIPTTLFYFLKIAVVIWGLLWFNINFWNICISSVKYAIGVLIGIALNLWIALGSKDILMMLILPVHEHGICFHLSVSSLISFLLWFFFHYRLSPSYPTPPTTCSHYTVVYVHESFFLSAGSLHPLFL